MPPPTKESVGKAVLQQLLVTGNPLTALTVGAVQVIAFAITHAMNASKRRKFAITGLPKTDVIPFLRGIPVAFHFGRRLRTQVGMPEGIRFVMARKKPPFARLTRGQTPTTGKLDRSGSVRPDLPEGRLDHGLGRRWPGAQQAPEV